MQIKLGGVLFHMLLFISIQATIKCQHTHKHASWNSYQPHPFTWPLCLLAYGHANMRYACTLSRVPYLVPAYRRSYVYKSARISVSISYDQLQPVQIEES